MSTSVNSAELVRRLSAAGHRVTQARTAVIEVIAGAEAMLDGAEILRRVRGLGVGRATVYRTLEMLETIGVIRLVMIDGRAHVDACGDPTLHFHLVCERCHGVTELHSAAESGLAALVHARGFEPSRGPIEVVGRCAECRVRCAGQ